MGNLSLISLISGVGAGLIVNLVTWLFFKKLIPWHLNKNYHDTRFDGNWKIENQGTSLDGEPIIQNFEHIVNLKQRANIIYGESTASFTSKSGKTSIINYSITGVINQGFLSMTFCNKDESRIGYSTFLMRIAGDGSLLKGYRIFYGWKMEKLRTIECLWTHSK